MNKPILKIWNISWHIIVPGVLGFLIPMLIACSRWPAPSMHDDFGNLLVASTLLEGRLTNPTPRAWESLETFHVVMQPTYASKYPIGLGFFLAVGKLMTGSFAAGLWIVSGLASASVAWMVAGAFSKRCAALSGLFAASHPYWQNGWSQEYTNGWLAVLGISLVIGGFLRLHRFGKSAKGGFWRTRLAIVGLGTGAVFAFYSRPFEGGVVCVLLGFMFLPLVLRRKLLGQSWFWRSAMPGIVILILGLSFQGMVNRAVTGTWKQLPYQLHETQYGVAPVLIWQAPHEPTLGHRFPELVQFHRGWSMDAYNKAASWSGYANTLRVRCTSLMNHWGNGLLLASLFALLLSKPRRFIWGFAAVAILALLVINGIPWTIPQYVSPIIPIAILLSCFGLKRIQRYWLRLVTLKANRSLATWTILLVLIGWNVALTASIAWDRMSRSPGWEETWSERRVQIVEQLSASPGPDLVLVRYPKEHDIVNQEWVFNEANVDATQVLWARSDGGPLDQKVRAAYPDRKIWRLDFLSNGKETLQELTEGN